MSPKTETIVPDKRIYYCVNCKDLEPTHPDFVHCESCGAWRYVDNDELVIEGVPRDP